MAIQKPVYSTDLLLFKYNNNRLQIALIERKEPPFKGLYSLPGGIVFPNETTKQAVKRITKTKTTLDINLSDIEPLKLYNNPNRDPRDWTITNTHILFQNPNNTPPFQSPIKWATITESELLIDNQSISLAFDHRQIIADALTQFRKWSFENPKQLKLLGDTFTIPQAIQRLNHSRPLTRTQFM